MWPQMKQIHVVTCHCHVKLVNSEIIYLNYMYM